MKLKNFFGHLHTVNRHKRLVMKYCFKISLYKRGLLHDLSKYSPTEFIPSVRYFVGYKSPNSVAREKTGVSLAWLHHKGRNRHHFEYWVDYKVGEEKGDVRLVGMKMHYIFLAEMFCDRVAASRVYKGKEYKDSDPYEYYLHIKGSDIIHPDTARELETLLKMLAEKGEEETFSFLKQKVKKIKKHKNYYNY